MDYKTILDAIGLFLSSFGAAIILFGAVWAIIKFWRMKSAGATSIIMKLEWISR